MGLSEELIKAMDGTAQQLHDLKTRDLNDELTALRRTHKLITEVAMVLFPHASPSWITWVVTATIDRVLDVDGFVRVPVTGTHAATKLEAKAFRHPDRRSTIWLLANGLVLPELWVP